MKYQQIKNLVILALSQFFCLSLWFSTNAIITELTTILHLTESDIASLSSAVIFGFVIGGIVSSIFSLPDVLEAQKVFFVSAFIGSITNLMIVFTDEFYLAIILRFFTGFFLAGIYPVGMKLTVSHFKNNRGLAIGILLSALTAGSGLPYIFNLTGVPNYKILISFSSGLSIIGGISVLLFVDDGPHKGTSTNFSIKNIQTIYSKPTVRYANLGYFGHMWELYAFWVWIPVMLRYSYESNFPHRESTYIVSFVTFIIFLAGAIANIIGGGISDKIGRTTFNIIMLGISGTSSLIIGFFVNNFVMVLLIGILWGTTIIPDSPQYSTMISELADQSLIGSALTIQTALGFTLTIFSIKLIPVLLPVLGWNMVFSSLTIGPVIGIIAMIKLRQNPNSVLIAQGKK